MKIAVTGGKGGTGKSTVAVSLSVLYSKNKKTILVDADADCPNGHIILNAKRKKQKTIFQFIPKFDFKKCTKCGKCENICKQNAIVFVKGKYPAFVKELCIGCKSCLVACPNHAVSESKKEIGKIYTGENYGVFLVSGELKLGELASGEVVRGVREFSDKIKNEIMIIDSAAGIGCPVIASIIGTDFVIAVTEPTPSAFHDLKRALYLAEHFGIKQGIVINKSDMNKKFSLKIEKFAEKNKIPILSKIPYRQDFVDSTIKMKPIIEAKEEYRKYFIEIIENINRSLK